MKNFHTKVHRLITLNNRISVISKEISDILEENTSVLDVGCGSGEISSEIQKNKSLDLRGIDILVRKNTKIPVSKYDGKTFPFKNNYFDYVIFIDVLHHVPNPDQLIKEAIRVSKKGIIIKDHNCNNRFQKRVLKFTDWFGNAQYGVHLEFNFLSKKEWNNMFNHFNLKSVKYKNPKIYPSFTRIIFWKEMDFISKLLKNNG